MQELHLPPPLPTSKMSIPSLILTTVLKLTPLTEPHCRTGSVQRRYNGYRGKKKNDASQHLFKPSAIVTPWTFSRFIMFQLQTSMYFIGIFMWQINAKWCIINEKVQLNAFSSRLEIVDFNRDGKMV